jgi:SAM-dependent methyltransferase
MFVRIDGCRSCGAAELETVLDLGLHALADGLLREEDLAEEEPRFPLTVAVCAACGLMQILENVDPEVLFCRDYPYFSSFSDALLRHSKSNVDELVRARGLTGESLVVELASNDGYLLQYYAQRGIPVQGIDPAEGPARAAEEKGVPTLNTFFTVELARELRAAGRRADVLHANNVLAHVPDLNGFVEGIATLLADDGVAVIECPHVVPLIRHCEFDTIYHQHHCYFSATALRPLFARHGLTLSDVRVLDIHGGSLRLYVSRAPGESAAVREALAEEAAEKLDTPEGYRTFGRRVETLRDDLRALLGRLKSEGASIAAYGAAAKGTTLVNYVGIGPDVVDFVVDRNTHKHGRYMPGQRLPIRPVEHLLEAQPDYTLLLAWNFKDEILAQQAEYVRRGGRFIVPVPEPAIV